MGIPAREGMGQPRAWAYALGVLTTLFVALVAVSVISGGGDAGPGFRAQALHWNTNRSFTYPWAAEHASRYGGVHPHHCDVHGLGCFNHTHDIKVMFALSKNLVEHIEPFELPESDAPLFIDFSEFDHSDYPQTKAPAAAPSSTSSTAKNVAPPMPVAPPKGLAVTPATPPAASSSTSFNAAASTSSKGATLASAASASSGSSGSSVVAAPVSAEATDVASAAAIAAA